MFSWVRIRSSIQQRFMTGKSKFYAVRNGRETGVFRTWAECQEKVKGFSGAKFKSFPSLEEATRFACGVTTNQSNASILSKTGSNSSKPKKGSMSNKLSVLSNNVSSSFRYLIYTDGACKGNSDVAKKQSPAGWGAVILENEESSLRTVKEIYGPVQTNPLNEGFIGAQVMSNNTGELSAIGHALQYMVDHSGELSEGDIVIRYDSIYAANSIIGIYNGEKNVALISSCREIYRRATAIYSVTFEKVKGHSNDKYNDIADELANRGAVGSVQLQDTIAAEI